MAVATILTGLWWHTPAPADAPQNAPSAASPVPVVSTVTPTRPVSEQMPPASDPAPGAGSPVAGGVLAQAPTIDCAQIAGTDASTGIAFGDMPLGKEAPAAETPWSRVPPLSPLSRPGWFLLPPCGPGYYTFLDYIKGNRTEKAPPYPYRVIFFDNDFRYLDRKGGEPVDWLDLLKRMHVCDGGCPWDDNGRPNGLMLSIGGEERVQFKVEHGGANGRFDGKDDEYQLLRSRVYGDLWISDRIRVYVEYLDAQTFNQDVAPLAIDVDHSDLLNAFVDVKLASTDDNPVYARVGRQELLYGSQRLISPLDWANTQRTFEGAKIFYRSKDFDLDGFWVRPVLTFPGRFDSADHNRQFVGAWAEYRPVEGQAIDAYYLYLDNDLHVLFGANKSGRGGYDNNTIGARWSGDSHRVLWDFEGGVQLGDFGGRKGVAGFTSTGLGYAFQGLPMQPQIWAYYDYASGSPDRKDPNSTFETFNQLFPFGHYYLGYLDEIGRQNIHDLNFQASAYPTKWITALVQYHIFRLDQANDALYGTPPDNVVVRFDPSGKAGTNVGEELDFAANIQLDRHDAILIGYSKFFSGDFIRETGLTPAARSANPEMFYVQYSFRW
jgi:hypothetical protein